MKRWTDAIPISARLTAAFALAMTVVLTITSLWVYDRQQDGLRAATDRRLSERRELLGREPGSNATADALVRADSGALQVYDSDGIMRASTDVLDDVRILSRSDVRAASKADRWTNVDSPLTSERTTRMLYSRFDGSELVIALLDPDDAGHESLEKLAVQLLAGAAAAVLLGSLLAFSLARAALRPVEQLRAEAQRRGRGAVDDPLPIPVARDEISRLAVTLNELLERMHAATLHERRFVAEAGHELRTPLATIIAEIELALESPLEPSVVATLRSLHEEAGRLSTLAEQLLQLATNRERVQSESTDIAALVDARVARFRRAFPRADLYVHDDGPMVATVDPIGIAQAVDNLIDNAVVHGGHRIDVSLSAVDDVIRVDVTDDGPGIDPDVAARAFERFARAPDARSRRGSGLGLAVVQSVAHLHHGAAGIGVRQDGLPGTQAWFTIVPFDPAREGR